MGSGEPETSLLYMAPRSLISWQVKIIHFEKMSNLIGNGNYFRVWLCRKHNRHWSVRRSYK